MKNFIKSLSLLMAMLLFATTSFAVEKDVNKGNELKEMMESDLDYFDDVYRFDLSIEKENEGAGLEKISNPEAVFAVLTLGIMKPAPGGAFNENELVSYSDFASMVYILSVGPDSGLDPDYSSYEDSNITVGEATYHVLNTLGYTLGREYGAFDEIYEAQKLGLFKTGNHPKEAFLTRGIAAQLFYNALEIDILSQDSYGEEAKYTVNKGATLLSNVFKAVKIEGLLNATHGVNIYSTVLPEKDQIQINRVTYETGNLDFTDLFGKYVEGYVRVDGDSQYPVVLGLKKSKKDSSLTVRLSDVKSVGNGRVGYYDGEKIKYLKTSGITNVLHNGEAKVNYTFPQRLIGGDGEIVFGKNGGEEYGFAIVKEKESYTVRYVAQENEKIFLNDGLLFNGSDYIDVSNEKEDRFIRIVKDGSIISLADIKIDDTISVIQRSDKLYTYIEVSDNSITGTINILNGDKIGIGSKQYCVSRIYSEAAKQPDATARKFVLGDSGTFFLSNDGIIAGYSGNDGVKYGILTIVAEKNEGLDVDLEARIFSENNEWINVKGAKKIELDGRKLSEAEAIEIIIAEKENIEYNPIRYKLNGDGELTFLDTMCSTEYSDSKKALTPERKETWTGKTNWASPYVIYNGNKSYSIFDAKFFIIPDEGSRDKEDLYSVKTSTIIQSDTTITLNMYNLDEMGHTPLVINQSTLSADLYGSRAMAIEEVWHTTLEDGTETLRISGYQSNGSAPGVGSWGSVTLTVSERLLNIEPDIMFYPGDIILWAKDATGKELINYELLVRNGQMHDGVSTTRVVDATKTYAYGTANAFNFDSSIKIIQVKADLGDGASSVYTFVPRGVQEWNSSEQVFKPIALDEISIGETIFIVGQGCHSFVTVFR